MRYLSNKNIKTKNISIYTETDYKNDQSRFDKSIKDGKLDLSSFQRLMVNDICRHTSIIETGCIGDINMRDIEIALKYPKQGWKILLAVSDMLMKVSPHYFRMNNLYSNMALFCWWIDLYDVKENAKVEGIKKSYSALAAKLESMNLTVLRICNLDIDRNFSGVCEYIDLAVKKSLPQSALLTAPSSEGALGAPALVQKP